VTAQVEAPPPAVREWEQRSVVEALLWVLAGAAVAVLLTWPLVRHLSTTVPHDNGDPLAQVWVTAWGGHGMLHQPFTVFNANTFWPERPSLAFSDSLIGYFPAGFVGSGPVAAVVRYNLLFLLAYTMAFAGAGLLARELGARPAAAAVAAGAFAWAPWRMSHNGHLNILSTGGIALSLFLVLSGYRRGRVWQIVAGWLVAGWQVSLGFGLGIYFCYLIALLAAIVAAEWLRRGRPRPSRAVLLGTVIGGVGFLVIVIVCVVPYLEVLHRYPDAPRSRADVAFFSPPWQAFFAADEESRVWGRLTAPARNGVALTWKPEQTLFPGVVVCVLAVLGLTRRRSSRRLRVALALSVVVGAVLCLGLKLHGGTFTYGPLYDVLPGWKGLRTPGRLSVFWSLGLALLAALGAQRLSELAHVAPSVPAARRALVGTALAALCAAAVLWEGSPRLPLAPVPAAPPGLAGVAEPQMHFPASGFDDDVYMLWSTEGFPRIGNGNASYLPPGLASVRQLSGFPDAASVQFLRARGYRAVLLHTDRAAGTPWADAANRSLDGLGISSRRIGNVVVFDLGSG
jgi:hypothetical protein